MGSFSPRDLGREYEPFYGPIHKKLEKYSGTRSDPVMLGLAMYSCISGDAYAGPLLAFLHALPALDDAFGLTVRGNATEIETALNVLFGPGDQTVILVVPMEVRLSFLMVHADKLMEGGAHKKTLLLINAGVIAD